jgi:hypothetical protein
MNATYNQSATPESVWAMFQEIGRKQEETGRLFRETREQMQETREQMQETDRRIQETDRLFKETREQIQETREQMKETDRRMRELQKTVGGWANNHGSFAEEYFFNAFERGEKSFFGKKFDEISKNVTLVWKNLKDEFDIVLYNDDAVAIIEVKYKAHENDIDTVLKKPETFRILFPNYKDFKIYLGLASMSFYTDLEQECINAGIAIIKQVGDAVVINDKHLKIY